MLLFTRGGLLAFGLETRGASERLATTEAIEAHTEELILLLRSLHGDGQPGLVLAFFRVTSILNSWQELLLVLALRHDHHGAVELFVDAAFI